MRQPIWNDTWADILRRDLLTTYDRYARPTDNMTDVHLGMNVKHFELDEAKSVFTASVWIQMVCVHETDSKCCD